MRAWNNEDAFKEWKKGVLEMAFPVTEDKLDRAEQHFIKAIEDESGVSFAIAAKNDQGFSRAWSRLGFCYMFRYIEGFDTKLGPEADEYTARAVRMDPLNYDVHWDRAIYHQLIGQFDLAEEAFDRARELNDCNVDLIVEQAELYITMGDHDQALKLLRKAGEFVHHDWFHWNFAWAYYFKARCDPVYYDLALDHIRAMHWQPGEPHYMYDVQLLKAIIHARMRDIETDNDIKAQQETLRLIAKAHFQDGCARYRPKHPGWGRDDQDRWHKFARNQDRDHWLEGVDLGLE
jgi:tetratricopeptide (TPR) repeat protein